MKIDFHTHILPRTWPDMKTKAGYGGWTRIEHTASGKATILLDDQFFREVSDNCWDVQKRLEECDAHGVGVQVLSTVPVMFGYRGKAEDTLYLCRFLNDHLAEVVRDHPARFVGLGTLPLQNVDLAIQELHRCVQELGLAGAEIGTHVNGFNLDEPSFHPFFAEAIKLNAILFVHPWDMLAKERMQRYFLPWLVGMPAETSLAMSSVIFGGILDRFPDIRFVFAHGGGSFPMSIGRMDRGYEARPDLCQLHIHHPPRAYLAQTYIDSLCHDPDILKFLINLFGPERILLGSDYPFPLGEQVPGKMIDSDERLDYRTKEQILFRNAAGLLRLNLNKIPAE